MGEGKLTVLVSEDLRRRAKTLASARGTTMSEIVRASLGRFVAVAAYDGRKLAPDCRQPYADLEADLAAELAAWDAASDRALTDLEASLS